MVHGVSLGLFGDRILALRGAQLSAVFNAADEVTGAQIGLVNVGGRVRGAQIGLVNVARELEGASLGLVPWVGGADGLHHLELYATDRAELALGWRIGARWLHTAVALATKFENCNLHIAVGSEVDLGRVALDIDLGPILGARRCAPAYLGGRTEIALRMLLGVRVVPGVVVFAGGSAGIATDDGAFRPGALAGLRFFE